MVSLIKKMKVGPKGQIVIPKLFRETLGIVPGQEVALEYGNDKVIIQKVGEPIHEVAYMMAKGRSNKLSPSKIREMAAEQ